MDTPGSGLPPNLPRRQAYPARWALPGPGGTGPRSGIGCQRFPRLHFGASVYRVIGADVCWTFGAIQSL